MTNDRDHHEPRAEEVEQVTVEESIEVLKPLGAEAPEVVDMGAKIGARRLARPLLGDIMTSFIGGLSVSFGAIAMAWADACFGGAPAPSVGHIAGALLFPIGFVILLVGKGELFTENFFLPVTAVLERRGHLMQLLSLWAVSLAFNLLGCLLFAYLITRPGVLAAPVTAQLIELSHHNVTDSLGSSFVRAIFAGWLMTLLTWLLLAAKGIGARLFIIWAVATLIVLARFNHTVISASEAFMALFAGADITPSQWALRNFLPALVGNVLGGTVMVTLLFYVQARFNEPGEADEPAERWSHFERLKNRRIGKTEARARV